MPQFMSAKNEKDTIVSLSSGLEKSAIALVRLSGKDCFSIGTTFLAPPEKLNSMEAGKIVRLSAVNTDGSLLDKVLCVAYFAPKSYTGENMLEIFCHGSNYIIRNIISLCIKAGARQAKAGEFTLRAYLNGKMDLLEAEAINDLINSETSAQHMAAISQLKGDLKDKIYSIKKGIISLLSEIEVRIDDSYEEIPDLDKKSFFKRLLDVKNEISEMATSFEKGKFIRYGINVVICGLPNCGKSSFLNAIAGYDRAIVSPTAGTTRDTLEESLEIGGFRFIFTDTAGLNTNSSDPLEIEGIKRTQKAISKANLILFLKDSSTEEIQEEKEAFLKVKENKNQNAIILTLLSKSDLKQKRKPNKGEIKFSAFTKEGIDDIKKSLESFCLSMPSSSSAIITSIRHFNCLSMAENSLAETMKIVETEGWKYEILAETLREALKSLEYIAGETNPEEILDEIFSNFCVGK